MWSYLSLPTPLAAFLRSHKQDRICIKMARALGNAVRLRACQIGLNPKVLVKIDGQCSKPFWCIYRGPWKSFQRPISINKYLKINNTRFASVKWTLLWLWHLTWQLAPITLEKFQYQNQWNSGLMVIGWKSGYRGQDFESLDLSFHIFALKIVLLIEKN